MKKFIAALFLIMAAAQAFAAQYETPMLNMTVPTGLKQGEFYVKFEHKFFQSFRGYPSDELFALFDGAANTCIELRYLAIAGLEVNASYITSNREQTIGLSYVFNFPGLFFNVQAGIQFFTYKDYIHNNYDQNLFYLAAVQSAGLLDNRLIISLDAAYDGYSMNPGLAIGVSYEVLADISILAEYYPVIRIDPDNGLIGTAGIYALGFKIQTSGHQFIFKFGNSADIGTRRLMMGADSLDMFAGFTIMRLIRF